MIQTNSLLFLINDMKVILTKSFQKRYKKLNDTLQKQFKEKLTLYLKDKKHPSLRIHKLNGELSDRYSLSITMKYRAIFKFYKPDTIEFINIGDHDIYQ